MVEDEPAISRALKTNLSGHGFQVETAETGSAGLEAFARRRPDLIILDLGLPDMEGTVIISSVRQQSSTPIIVLSVRGSERDKVAALDSGADDYVTKPFSVDELLARMRVALRHAARPTTGTAPVFRLGELQVDLEYRRVSLAGEEVHLTPTEYDLLRAFIAHPDKVLTDRMLLQSVWGSEYGGEVHYLHVYIGRLRRKIEPDPQQPQYLITEPGVGYRLRTDAP